MQKISESQCEMGSGQDLCEFLCHSLYSEKAIVELLQWPKEFELTIVYLWET